MWWEVLFFFLIVHKAKEINHYDYDDYIENEKKKKAKGMDNHSLIFPASTQ